MSNINKVYQKQNQDNIISKIKFSVILYRLTKKLALRFIIYGVILGFGYIGWRFPKPQRMLVGNMGATSFSVAWNTSKTTKGCVVVYQDPKHPEDWIWKCEKDFNYTHLVDIHKLEPETQYGVIVIDGFWISFRRFVPVVTKPISSEAPLLPQPAYGRVIDPNGIGADRALVVLYPESSEFIYPLLGLTNEQGRYVFDLGEVIYSKDYLRLEAVASAGIWAEQKTLTNLTQPVPQIKVVAR